MVKPEQNVDHYSDAEAKCRFEQALRGAELAESMPMKDIPPKRKKKQRKQEKKQPTK